MDLLIKNMEMPSSCQECIYVLGYNVPMCPDDATLENYLEDERLGRHPSCPLVALPEHGRLIEENKAYDSIAEEATDHCIDMDAVGKGLECTPTILEASNG